jgi:AcrR family transcriptional regulator
MDNNSPQKQAIADTFQKHFQHFGFKKTSVDDISNELHISKKTIYQYFSTKEEIFYYVVNQIARQYLKRMENDLAQSLTYREKLTQLIHMIFSEAKNWLKDNDAFEFRYKYEIAELAFKDAYSELMKQLLERGVEAGVHSACREGACVHLFPQETINPNSFLTIQKEKPCSITL